ncbi:MAG TPA: hypothetical protein VN625_09840 [Desulfuromonadaceae bacterium]|nr:hypothetical protein [Desulfuromonadaceae bacterium]
MNTSFVYLDIQKPNFEFFARRFIETYTAYPGGAEHELIVGAVGQDPTGTRRKLFDSLKCRFIDLPGDGWGITCFQKIAATLESDFAVFCEAKTYFHRAGWLKKLVEARTSLGEGFFGGSGHSLECVPHLRTALFGLHPKALASFRPITTREEAGNFEHGKDNITETFNRRAYSILWDGVVHYPFNTITKNNFRSGDQSNVLAFDRHTDLYAEAPAARKRIMEKQALGKYNGIGKLMRLKDELLFKIKNAR